MAVNAHRGESAIVIDGVPRTLWFGWEGLALIQDALGRKDVDAAISEVFANLDMATLAKLLEIGLRRSLPPITADDIMEASPPIEDVLPALMLALKRTFRGATPDDEGVPGQPDANPQKPPSIRARISSFLGSRRQPRPASVKRNFGIPHHT